MTKLELFVNVSSLHSFLFEDMLLCVLKFWTENKRRQLIPPPDAIWYITVGNRISKQLCSLLRCVGIILLLYIL